MTLPNGVEPERDEIRDWICTFFLCSLSLPTKAVGTRSHSDQPPALDQDSNKLSIGVCVVRPWRPATDGELMMFYFILFFSVFEDQSLRMVARCFLPVHGGMFLLLI